jgi:hypothetical protein
MAIKEHGVGWEKGELKVALARRRQNSRDQKKGRAMSQRVNLQVAYKDREATRKAGQGRGLDRAHGGRKLTGARRPSYY